MLFTKISLFRVSGFFLHISPWVRVFANRTLLTIIFAVWTLTHYFVPQWRSDSKLLNSLSDQSCSNLLFILFNVTAFSPKLHLSSKYTISALFCMNSFLRQNKRSKMCSNLLCCFLAFIKSSVVSALS